MSAWPAAPYLTFPLAILLFGAGVFQLTWRRTSIGRAVSIGLLFGLLASSAEGLFHGMIVRSFVDPRFMFSAVSGRNDYTDAEAKSYFDQREQTFIALVDLISQCEGLGRISIYPNGDVLSTMGGAVKCPSTAEISMLLRAADILLVNADNRKPYGEQGPFSAMFVLSSRGMVGRGSGTAIYYLPELGMNAYGDSFPLQGKPGHWFYSHL
jgi:hypothetical protein